MFEVIVELLRFATSTVDLVAAGARLLKIFNPADSWLYYKAWGFVGAVTVFLLARIFQILGFIYNRYQQKRRIMLALYTEVSFNVRGLRKYNLSVEDTYEYSRRIASFTPVLIVSGHDDVLMRGHVGELGLLPASIVQKTGAFYARLREADAAVSAVNSDAFVGISHEGRINSVNGVFRSTRLAFNLGTQIVRDMRAENGAWFFCRKRPSSVKWAARAARFERLAQNPWAAPWTRLLCRAAIHVGITGLFRWRSTTLRRSALRHLQKIKNEENSTLRIRKGGGSSDISHEQTSV